MKMTNRHPVGWAAAASTNFLMIFAVLCVGGCGDDDDDKSCDPASQRGCEGAQVCELVDGSDTPACFAPVEVRGSVFDLADGTAVEGARIVALDVNRSPVSSVALSGVGGEYHLWIPSTRQSDGTPIGIELTLRADAKGYQTFPSALRQPLPVDTGVTTVDDGTYVVESSATDIGLIALPAGSGDGAIAGVVEAPDGVGVLIVAEDESGVGAGAVADRDGDYRIENLAAGAYTVRAYAQGVNYDAAEIDLAAGETAQVNLAANDAPTSTLNGKVSIVDPEGGVATSVILAVESTFIESLTRGESPPGLRAPEGGLEPSIAGDFVIEGVPEGRYVVLAAFENDQLVRDPNTCNGGTAIVHQEIVSGQDVTLEEGFKVTGSLDVIRPGADGAEEVDGTPELSWVDDDSEDSYHLTVFDAYGNLVWETDPPRETSSDPVVTYGGPALEPGMYYQYRVTSISNNGCELAQTEDLKGVFFLAGE